MSVHVLLTLLNGVGKRDKLRGLPSILSLSRHFPQASYFIPFPQLVK